MRVSNAPTAVPNLLRAATRHAVVVGLTAAVFGAGLIASALPAYADVTTNSYTVGSPSGSVSSVVASPGSVGQSALTGFEVTFSAPVALSGPGGGSVTVTPSSNLSSPPANVDLLGGSCIQAGTAGVAGAGSATVGGLVVDLRSTCSFSAGAKVEVDFAADAPSSPGTFHFSVATSKNATAAISNTVSIGSAGPVLTAASVEFGANTTYTVSSVPVASLSADQSAVKLSAVVTSGSEAISFYGGPAGYRVTSTPAGGPTTQDAVNGVTLSSANHVVTLALASPLADGGTLNITALGTNPAASAITQANAIAVQAGNGTAETTNSISFGESVTGVSVVPSTPVAGASATYVVTFRASDDVGVGADIFLSETAEQTDFTGVSGILVTDSTQAWHFVATSAILADGSARVPLLMAVKSEDSVTMTLVGVKNPPAGTVSDFAVSTSADFVASDAAPFTIGASAGATVSVNPSTTGSLATYVISNLYASAPMSAGSSTLALDAPTGTVFPNSPADYSLEDATTPSGSGAVSAALAGGGSNDVTLKVPNGINAGDRLTITVLDAINPSVASSTYTIGLVGPVTGPSTAAVPFPHASVNYPNGAIISFSGADYVLAGGHAFAVTASKILAAVEKVDHGQAEAAAAGAKPPGGPPRAGTLLTTRPVNGATTVYVVGTDGELHGFASPKQFTGDGYDPALVITVPSLGGIKVGASAGAEGPAANARGTSSDGAIVDSSGMYFVFAGGRAFSVANLSQLASVRRADKAEVLSGSVGPAQENAGIASGVVLSALGPVYVSYLGNLFPFKSMGQLSGDGYGGTAAVHVPGTAGLPVVPSYTGT